MALKAKAGTSRVEHETTAPKKTRQAQSLRTSLAARSRNQRRKRYRGQGK